MSEHCKACGQALPALPPSPFHVLEFSNGTVQIVAVDGEASTTLARMDGSPAIAVRLARIFAAAPEMLSLLKQELAAFDHPDSWHDTGAIRLLIARAEQP